MRDETILILDRTDLTVGSRFRTTDLINITSFRVRPEYLNRFPIVLFMDENGNTKILKNRYGQPLFNPTEPTNNTVSKYGFIKDTTFSEK